MKTIQVFLMAGCLILLAGLPSIAQESKKQGDVYFIVEQMPEYPGGDVALREFIANAVKYPEEAQKEGIAGKVYVTFVVDEKGAVADAKIARSASPSLDKEALRVVNTMPAWKPGMEKGKAVKVSFTVPINFVLDGNSKTNPNENGVYSVVEVMPSFPGGDVALRDYVIKKVVYPEDAKKAGIQGKVYVSFVIDEKGRVESAKVVRSANPLLDNEALRVVKEMPEWKPGTEKGKAVKVEYTMPVNFALN